MKCTTCGAKTIQGFTTDVTDLGNCLVIVRNVPCFKCVECDEVIYTGVVIRKLEKIVENAKHAMNEIAIINYSDTAA